MRRCLQQPTAGGRNPPPVPGHATPQHRTCATARPRSESMLEASTSPTTDPLPPPRGPTGARGAADAWPGDGAVAAIKPS